MKILFVLILAVVVLVSGCVSPQQDKCNWEAGPCEKLIADGYYFDSGTNQCKEFRGGSGCSDPPFEKLAECQSTCGGSFSQKTGGEECRENAECQSGVCDFYKQLNGKCAPLPCTAGDKTNHGDFYCGENSQWQRTKDVSSACQNDFECFQPNCYEVPVCNVKEKISCKNNVCVSETIQDECEKQGLVKITNATQYSENCFESMAQMTLPYVCAPCGNGVCDKDLEDKCNCAEDCPE